MITNYGCRTRRYALTPGVDQGLRAGSSRTQIRGLPSRSCLLGLSESCGDPGVSEPTSVGLDVHTRSVVAVAIDGSPAASLPAAPQSASSPGSPAPPSVLVHGSVSGDRILITYLCVDLAFRGSGIALSLNERLRDEGDDSEPPTSLPATSTPMWPWAASTPDSATADCTARLASSDISMPPPPGLSRVPGGAALQERLPSSRRNEQRADPRVTASRRCVID